MDPFALLNPDEKSYAQTTGLKVADAPELFVVTEGARLVWSVKGLQFLRCACEAHGLPYAPQAVETHKDLLRLAIDMSSVRLARLRAHTSSALSRRQLPANEREFAHAALAGGLEEVLDAAQRQDDCHQAGDNVIPAQFGYRPA